MRFYYVNFKFLVLMKYKLSQYFLFPFLFVLFFITQSCIKTSTLHDAVKQGDFKRVVRLVNKGADINEKDSVGSTPLFWAAGIGNIEITQYLISKGADVNADFEYGGLPLTAAVVGGSNEHMKIIPLLLQKGADINICSELYGTPLHSAVMDTNIQMINLLLKNGADINIKRSDGSTPLSIARWRENSKIISLLNSYNKGIEDTIVNIESINRFKTLNTVEASREFISRALNLEKESSDIYSFKNPKLQDETKLSAILNKWTLLWIDISTYYSVFKPELISEVSGEYYSIVMTALTEAIVSSNYIGNRLLSSDHLSLVIKLLELKIKLLEASFTDSVPEIEILYPNQPISFLAPAFRGYYNDPIIMASHFDFMNTQFHSLFQKTKNTAPSNTTDDTFNVLIWDLCNSRICSGRLLDNQQKFQISEIYRVSILLDIIESLTIYLIYKTNDQNQEDLLKKITDLKEANKNANINLFSKLSTRPQVSQSFNTENSISTNEWNSRQGNLQEVKGLPNRAILLKGIN